MSNSKVEARYGTPLPLDVLWRELETRYGPAAVAELQAIHRQAARRYGRAAELERRRRLVAYWERSGNRGETVKRYRESLADPQAFIDRE
jgi:hypothetical protein